MGRRTGGRCVCHTAPVSSRSPTAATTSGACSGSRTRGTSGARYSDAAGYSTSTPIPSPSPTYSGPTHSSARSFVVRRAGACLGAWTAPNSPSVRCSASRSPWPARAPLAGRLVAHCGEPLPETLAARDGEPTHLFPGPHAVAGAALDGLGVPAARRETLRTLARVLAGGRILLDPGSEREEVERRLLELRGIRSVDRFVRRDAGAR